MRTEISKPFYSLSRTGTIVLWWLVLTFFSLTKINSDYGELGKTCEKLPSMGIVPMVPALGNNGQLSLDSSIEKVQLYQQIQRGHVWWEHVQGNWFILIKFLTIFSDHISVSHSLLARNMLKRTSYPHSHPQNKIQRPPSKSHYPPNDNINFLFMNMQKTYQQDLKFSLHLLYGHSRVMQVSLGWWRSACKQKPENKPHFRWLSGVWCLCTLSYAG